MKLIFGFPKPDDEETDHPGRWLLACLQVFAAVLALMYALVVYLPPTPAAAPDVTQNP